MSWYMLQRSFDLDFKSATEVMFELERYGQKNGAGFYEYVEDKRGKPKKTVNEDVYGMIAEVAGDRAEFEREDIIMRMMHPWRWMRHRPLG